MKNKIGVVPALQGGQGWAEKLSPGEVYFSIIM